MSLPAHALPRLLAGFSPDRQMSLAEHVHVHGALPAGDRGLRQELSRSGLHGCGGGSFPFARKLDAVAARRGRPVVVVNGSEGEPLSWKDKLLLGHLPHLVLDGAVASARALGAREIVVAVESTGAAGAVHRAINEREGGRREGVSLRVQAVPASYLTGQETALIAALSGRPPLPAMTPPYPFEKGLAGRPTLLSNAETYAHAGLIARNGADWFRALGTRESPGTRLVTVTGAVAHAGVIEVAGGTEVKALLSAAGGITEPVVGLLFGGYAGIWAGVQARHWQLGEAELRSHGASLGPGIVLVLGQSSCPVSETARAARWLSDQSAGQCGPCVNGLDAIAGALEQLCDRGDHSGAYTHLERWCSLVNRRGACSLPDGAARFVITALRTFRPVFKDHALHGRCESCHQQGARRARSRERLVRV